MRRQSGAFFRRWRWHRGAGCAFRETLSRGTCILKEAMAGCNDQPRRSRDITGQIQIHLHEENFTAAEAKCLYRHLKRTIPGTELGGSVLAVDAYGGAINKESLVR